MVFRWFSYVLGFDVSGGFDQTFSLPSHDDMADELREPTPDEMRRSPEALI